MGETSKFTTISKEKWFEIHKGHSIKEHLAFDYAVYVSASVCSDCDQIFITEVGKSKFGTVETFFHVWFSWFLRMIKRIFKFLKICVTGW